MKFFVRYWSSLLPQRSQNGLFPRRWVDYSVHPASKLGLHNALLVVHDRLEILQAHGGEFECAVYIVDGEQAEKLTPDMANALFPRLPQGEVKWLDIHEFLLPANSDAVKGNEAAAVTEQLPLFEHLHTPYDDLESKPHSLDVEI